MSFITITGCDHYLGANALRVNQTLVLKKDFDNLHDGEAIAVHLESGMKIGYVANSVRTVARGTYSAGRVYDTFDMKCYAKVKFILRDCAIAETISSEELEETI